MSLFSYQNARNLAGTDFHALIMAAIMKADDINAAKLRRAWPDIYDELQKRYNAPQGLLPGEFNPETGDTREDLDRIRKKVGLR